MRKLLYLLLFTVCVQYSVASQQVDIAKTVKDQLYIQTDRDYYLKGSTLFFKAYLSDQSGQLGTSKSEVIYVDLISSAGKIEETKSLKVLDGTATGSFNLGFEKNDGQYLIRGYTNYMRNFDSRDFFRKVIFIENGKLDDLSTISAANTSTDVSINIYPEGGYLVNGLQSSVLIYATDGNGNPVSSTFDLMENNVKLSSHQTDSNGFIKFQLTPNKDAQYTISSNNTTSKFSQPIDKVLSISTTILEENLKISIASLSKLSEYSLAIIQGKNILETKNVNEETSQDIDLDLNDLPAGNLRLAILNPQNKIVAERYIFNHLGIDNYNVDFELDAESYDRRSLASISVDVYDDEGESLPGNYTISIVDRSFNKNSSNNHNIRSSTLLSTGTRFNSADPNTFINNSDNIDIQLIDNFMIMHGNSSNDIIESKTAEFIAEKDMSLKGKIHLKKDPTKGISASGEMYLLQSFLDVNYFHADETGNFTLPLNLDSDSIDVLFKVGEVKKNKKTNQVEVKANSKLGITLFDQESPPVSKHSLELLNNSKPMSFQSQTKKTEEAVANQPLDDDTIYKYEDLLRSQDFDGTSLSIELDEVSIKAEKLYDDVNFYKKTMLYSTPNTRIETWEVKQIQLYDDIYSLLRRFPSVQLEGPISGSGTRHTVILRGFSSGLASGGNTDDLLGANAAKFMLNGAFVSQASVEAIRPSEIAFIDIISSLSQLTQFGENGVNGVIAVYLKTVENDERPKIGTESDLLPKKIRGFHVPDLFEYKNYLVEQSDKYDSRTTIYWDPDVRINDSGNTNIEFFTADRYTTYDIIIEGIADNGLPVRATSEILISN